MFLIDQSFPRLISFTRISPEFNFGWNTVGVSLSVNFKIDRPFPLHTQQCDVCFWWLGVSLSKSLFPLFYCCAFCLRWGSYTRCISYSRGTNVRCWSHSPFWGKGVSALTKGSNKFITMLISQAPGHQASLQSLFIVPTITRSRRGFVKHFSRALVPRMKRFAFDVASCSS